MATHALCQQLGLTASAAIIVVLVATSESSFLMAIVLRSSEVLHAQML